MLHPEAEAHFNKEAFELIQLVKELPPEPYTPQNIKGSQKEKIAEDWSDKIVPGPSLTQTVDHQGIPSSMFEEDAAKRIGFEKRDYEALDKFLKKIYKQKEIGSKVSYDFLVSIAFKWFIETYKSKQASSSFTSFIFNEVAEACKNYKYSFEILYLDIDKPFSIGNVLFEYLTEEYFDNYLSNKFTNKPPEKLEEFNKHIRTKYQGRTYATYLVKGCERGKAEEIALRECSLAIDVLKLFSPTVFQPDYHVDFDIDRRVMANDAFETIVRTEDDDYEFSLDFAPGFVMYHFTEEQIDQIFIRGKNFIHLISIENKNELQKLLILSINRFSLSISNKDLHKRVIDLFTIWESLLLPDTSASIMDSVTMYGSKLLRRTIEERKEFTKFLKRMYEIRSAMVHHAKRKDIDIADLHRLQMDTVGLIEVLTVKSLINHQTKKSVLDEIDNAIHQAYPFHGA